MTHHGMISGRAEHSTLGTTPTFSVSLKGIKRNVSVSVVRLFTRTLHLTST